MPSTPAPPLEDLSGLPEPSADWGSVAVAWAAYRAGDTAAGSRLWAACREYLLLVARQELPAELAAKVAPSDLVQETLKDAQQKIGEFRGDSPAELLGWLRRILRNDIVDLRRSFVECEKREVAREISLEELGSAGEIAQPPAVSATPWRELADQERNVQLRRALARLPDEYRLVIAERIWQRRSFSEIAAAWNRSPDAVRKIWLRALARLAQEWPRDDSAPLG